MMKNCATEERAWREHAGYRQVRQQEAKERLYRETFQKSLKVQGVLFLVVLIVWGIPYFNPVKLVVVLVHELSHAMTAYLTGGVVFGIILHPGGNGATLGLGGNLTLIALAGYTGSLIFGVVLYYLSAVWQPKEVWWLISIFSYLSMIFGWLNSFTIWFAVTSIIIVHGIALLDDDKIQKLGLRLIAITSILYPFLEVIQVSFGWMMKGFKIEGVPIASDAAQLAELMGTTTGTVGVLWIIAAGLSLAGVIVITMNREAKGEVLKSFLPARRIKRDSAQWDNRRPFEGPRYQIK